MLPDEQMSPEQIAIYGAMTGQQRLLIAEQLWWTARKLKTAGVRAMNPEWSNEQVEAEVRRIFTNAST